MGSAFCYFIEKKQLREDLSWAWLSDIDEQTVKEELFKNFNSKIYCLEEDDEFYNIKLREDISVNDFLVLYDEFRKVEYEHDEREQEERNVIRKEISELNNIYEVLKYADNSHVGFWHFYLHFFRMYIKIANKSVCIKTRVKGISLYLANNKTISESNFESYDLFTNYLRFRLQHTKLADSMLIFLTE